MSNYQPIDKELLRQREADNPFVGEWDEPEPEVYEVRDQRLSGYYWIESALLEKHGKDIGPYGIAVYNVLACRADNRSNTTFVSAEYIADKAGMSLRQVYRALKVLEDKKLILAERRPGRSTLFILVLLERNEKKAGKVER